VICLQNFNEPNYQDYIETDIGGLFREHTSLVPHEKHLISSTKVRDTVLIAAFMLLLIAIVWVSCTGALIHQASAGASMRIGSASYMWLGTLSRPPHHNV
jgi:hypothetical protein